MVGTLTTNDVRFYQRYLGVIFLFWLVLTVMFSFLAAKMFEFNVWCLAHLNLPWYLDVGGGLVLNGINLGWFVVTLILRLSGVPTPFMEVSG